MRRIDDGCLPGYDDWKTRSPSMPSVDDRGRRKDWRKHEDVKLVKRSLQTFVRAYGVETLQRLLVDVFPPDTKFAEWVDARDKR